MKNILERKLNDTIRFLKDQGLGYGFKNNPNRNHKGIYLEGENFDYCVFTHQFQHFFDCKETITDRIDFTSKEIKQINNLYCLSFLNKQFDCYFLVYYKNRAIVKKYPIDFLANLTKKSINYKEGFKVYKIYELFT